MLGNETLGCLWEWPGTLCHVRGAQLWDWLTGIPLTLFIDWALTLTTANITIRNACKNPVRAACENLVGFI